MSKLAIDGGTPVRTTPFPNWPVWGAEEEKLILEVLHSGNWGGANKDKLAVLEQQFAHRHGARHAINISNGTIAMTVALMAAGIEPGDEVIMPPYTFIATGTAALLAGAIPIFADVEEDTLLIDPHKVEERITPRTKAIIAVHIAGAPANMTSLKAIADRHGLFLLEDAAQAVGASWENHKVGTLGHAGTFSFQSSKNINSGEGGIILTDDDTLMETMWSIANVGRVPGGAWYQHERIGWNFRMTEFQAAVILGQMTRMDEQIRTRARNAALLDKLISGLEQFQPFRNDERITTHAYHIYMFKIRAELASPAMKEQVIRMLHAEGIPVLPGYHSLNCNTAIIAETAKRTGKQSVYPCPVSERISEAQVLWLGQAVLLGGEQDIYDVADALRKVSARMNAYGLPD
ncbi:DegT/DnrJ/EryC1/StrS family aminotransferase [Paenibacillus sp. J5C_2022]|uniref:DegT/DnrJ/EryC1/StrS family aminotransferase n=1 Tax=Paenibacillus sp. J5C2022 TaxID=2977129 RepID=UPI0021D1F45D|nr:DegT/DnrJ/EryC1/StrS family aminotransferase [Paenibacillus sp. J5C2022]MCU6707787.1 DegT/DnrJ/EryC1/StrS family aminotransferase [Paenibacillus sp. J5C2022]